VRKGLVCKRVDWFRVLADLQSHGLSNAEVARRIAVPRVTVWNWKAGAGPKFSHGSALVELWSSVVGPSIDLLPMCKDYRFRR